jgi:exodeoxyribonuclease VII large subunit
VNRRSPVARLEPREGEPRVLSVSDLVREINWSLEASLPLVLVQGEITGLKPHPGSGHIYFNLKDEHAQIRVALFKNRARREHADLEDGLVVQVEGKLDYYAKGGSLSIVAERVSPVGYGALQARFEALKRKLEAEGLFLDSRKRPLPPYPESVGIVTSPSGAAFQDMLRVLRQRAPYVRVTLAPAAVQGDGAAAEIAAAIELLNAWGGVDLIIVGRGGGSPQDLWAFNEEEVVRAIAGSKLPVVSAVGHEVDFTLADFAADLRAATPTHAAQQVVPDRAEVFARLESLTKHAKERLRAGVRESETRLRGIRTHHALREPLRLIQDGRRTTDDLSDALGRGLSAWVLTRRRRVESIHGVLQVYSPDRSLARARERVAALRHRAERASAGVLGQFRERTETRARLLASYDYRGVLRRGYALVWSEDGSRLIQRGLALKPEEMVEVQFQDARAGVRVVRVEPAASKEKS